MLKRLCCQFLALHVRLVAPPFFSVHSHRKTSCTSLVSGVAMTHVHGAAEVLAGNKARQNKSQN